MIKLWVNWSGCVTQDFFLSLIPKFAGLDFFFFLENFPGKKLRLKLKIESLLSIDVTWVCLRGSWGSLAAVEEQFSRDRFPIFQAKFSQKKVDFFSEKYLQSPSWRMLVPKCEWNKFQLKPRSFFMQRSQIARLLSTGCWVSQILDLFLTPVEEITTFKSWLQIRNIRL